MLMFLVAFPASLPLGFLDCGFRRSDGWISHTCHCPAVDTQIHHLMGGKDLVGASGKAGYDGYGTNTTITNEVQSLCNRESCHSSMGRSIARGA